MPETSRAEMDDKITEWYRTVNKKIGAVKDLSKYLGPYPIDIDDFYGQQMNEYVTTDSIRHFVAGSGERNPLFWNEAYAKKSRWGGIIAPPMFTDWICAPWTARRVESPSPMPWGFIGLPSGVKREILQPIRPGDKFKVHEKWMGLTERQSRAETRRFRLFFNTDQRTYINQTGQPVAIVEGTWVILATYEAPSEAKEPLFAGGVRKRHKQTDKERDAVTHGYDTETRRGANTLFWEDVNVGEELKPLVAGPISSWDVAAFFVGAPGRTIAFDMEWERIKSDFKFAWLNPEVNAWFCGGEGHLHDGASITPLVTGGYAFTLGGHVEWLISRMICNWMGDDGFLKRCQVQFRAAPIRGDVITVKGKVIGKSIEGGEHVVELEVSGSNQDALTLVPGTATVRLLTKSEAKTKSK